MPRSLRALALALLVVGAASVGGSEAVAQEAAQEVDAAALLSDAVDRPTPRLRRQAADELAKLETVFLERWIVVCQSFGGFGAVEPGLQQQHALLTVGGEPQPTTIATYVPAKYDPGIPAPLVISFHGTGGDGNWEPERWKAVAEDLGMIVIAPTETGANDGYRFSRRERDAAFAALRWARRTFNVDENRIFATGISRGGHLTWDIALRFPDVFAGLAPMIGGPRINLRNGENNLRYIDHLAHVPIRDLQGLKDDPLMILNLNVAFDRLREAGAQDAQLVTFPELGHHFDLDAVDWIEFFGQPRRDPRPKKVRRLCARRDEGRAFWIEAASLGKRVLEEFPLKVDPAKWKAADDAGKRRMLMAVTDRKTGRIDAEWVGPGRFVVKVKGVSKVRLLLSDEMLDPGKPVSVKVGSRTAKKPAERSVRVLLREFVERFDRTFLPVVEVVAP